MGSAPGAHRNLTLPAAGGRLSLASRLSLALAVLRSKAAGDFDFELHNVGAFGGSTNQPPTRSSRALLNAYCASPWLRAVGGKISSMIGSTTWRLYAPVSTEGGTKRYFRRPQLQHKSWSAVAKQVSRGLDNGELEEIEDHPFFGALHPTWAPLSGVDVLGLAQLYLEVVGEAFLVKRRAYDLPGAPTVGLYPFPPTWFSETPDSYRETYGVSSPYWTGTLPARDVVWLKVTQPVNPYGRGYGTAGVLSDELETDEFAAKYVKSWFYNSARPDLIITVEGMKEEDRKPLEMKWREKLQGFWKSHQPFFVSRKVDVKQVGYSFRDMELSSLRRFERDVVLQVWGFPPEVFGILENSNRSTIDAADYMTGKYVTVPRLEYLRAVLQASVIEEYDPRLILGYDSPVAEDKEFKRQVMEKAPGAVRVDDWRELAGLRPIGGRLGKSAVVTLNTVYQPLMSAEEEQALREEQQPIPGLAAVLPPALPPAVKQLPGCSCTTGARPRKGVRERDVAGNAGRPASVLAKAVYDPRPIMALVERLQPDMRDAFLDAIENLRDEVDHEALIAALEAKDDEEAKRILNPAGLSAALAGMFLVVRRALLAAGEAHAEALSAALETEVDFPAAEALKWLDEHKGRLGSQLNETTTAAVTFALQWARESGRTPAEQAHLLEELLGLNEQQARAALNVWGEAAADRGPRAADRVTAAYVMEKRDERADAVADDEAVGAANAAGSTLWGWAEAAGIIAAGTMGREWVDQGDEVECDSCRAMSGVTVPLGMPWPTDFGELMEPSDSHSRCRCTSALVVM